MIAALAERLVAYQNERYAARFREFLGRVRSVDAGYGEDFALTRAVARNYFKLLAYKDEYEVARLYTDGAFERALAATFVAPAKLRFSMAPPIFARRDAHGRTRKIEFGAWLFPILRGLKHLKILRGTRFDIFGYSNERQRERALIGSYRASLENALAGLDAATYAEVVELAEVPAEIRGFGHVKLTAIDTVLPKWRALEAALGYSSGV
jgi:indolepyruvate ferredoxin oxidoreductase